MSFTDKVDELHSISSFINIHEATQEKCLYAQHEALKLKIIFLESSDGLQIERGVNKNHIVVLKKGNVLSQDQITKRDLWKRKLSCQKR